MAEFVFLLQEAKGILLLSSPEQQLWVKPSPGLALQTGSGTLPCPLPPGWWPWQHSQSFLAKSFSRNPSLSLALALGQERRQKDISRECMECQQLLPAVLQPLSCCHRILLSLSEHPPVIQGSRHKQPGALWEIRPFLTAGIKGSQRWWWYGNSRDGSSR